MIEDSVSARSRATNEIYVVTDIESDGPLPGVHSMLSFASVAVTQSWKALAGETPSGEAQSAEAQPGEIVGEFSRNLELLPEARPDSGTQAFWDDNPEAYARTRENPVSPREAMTDYRDWLETLPGRPVFVAYPAGFDFTFVYWYFVRFTGSREPLGFSALDMKTLAMALLRVPYRSATKRRMPRRWIGPKKHTHIALDDAREQAYTFSAMMRELHEAD